MTAVRGQYRHVVLLAQLTVIAEHRRGGVCPGCGPGTGCPRLDTAERVARLLVRRRRSRDRGDVHPL